MLLQFTGDYQFSQLGGVIAQFNRAIELDPSFPAPYQGLSQALIYADDVAQSLAVARRAVELGPSDADGLLFLANALFESGETAEAMDAAKRAIELNPLRPPFYYLFNSMILWGNERYQEALDEADECLRKAPDFAGAATYRAVALVGLGRLDEAKAQLRQCMARPGGIVIVMPHPPELASRALADLRPPVGAPLWSPTVRPADPQLSLQHASETFSALSGPRVAVSSRLLLMARARASRKPSTPGGLRNREDHHEDASYRSRFGRRHRCRRRISPGSYRQPVLPGSLQKSEPPRSGCRPGKRNPVAIPVG
jgi:tetratricopeptide (TPR) repeat protein